MRQRIIREGDVGRGRRETGKGEMNGLRGDREEGTWAIGEYRA
jgi:hypothetical protein